MELAYAGEISGIPASSSSLALSLVRKYGAEIIDPVFQILKNGATVQRLTPELTGDDTRNVVDYTASAIAYKMYLNLYFDAIKEPDTSK